MASLNAITNMNAFFQKNLRRFVSKHPGEYAVLEVCVSGVKVASFHEDEQVAYHAANLPSDYSSIHYIPTSLPPKLKLHYIKGVGRVPSWKDCMDHVNRTFQKRRSLSSPADDILFR